MPSETKAGAATTATFRCGLRLRQPCPRQATANTSLPKRSAAPQSTWSQNATGERTTPTTSPPPACSAIGDATDASAPCRLSAFGNSSAAVCSKASGTRSAFCGNLFKCQGQLPHLVHWIGELSCEVSDCTTSRSVPTCPPALCLRSLGLARHSRSFGRAEWRSGCLGCPGLHRHLLGLRRTRLLCPGEGRFHHGQ